MEEVRRLLFKVSRSEKKKAKITTILEIRCCGLFLLKDNKLSKRNWRNYAKRTAEYQRKFD